MQLLCTTYGQNIQKTLKMEYCMRLLQALFALCTCFSALTSSNHIRLWYRWIPDLHNAWGIHPACWEEDHHIPLENPGHQCCPFRTDGLQCYHQLTLQNQPPLSSLACNTRFNPDFRICIVSFILIYITKRMVIWEINWSRKYMDITMCPFTIHILSIFRF